MRRILLSGKQGYTRFTGAIKCAWQAANQLDLCPASRGLEAIKKCTRVYLEAYTSILLCEKDKLVSPPNTAGTRALCGFTSRSHSFFDCCTIAA